MRGKPYCVISKLAAHYGVQPRQIWVYGRERFVNARPEARAFIVSQMLTASEKRRTKVKESAA